jgi:NAD-dependent deacetylase
LDQQIRGAREALARASQVAVLSGAGISAESGIPTFRGAGGLWKTFRAEDLATPAAFERDPALVWEWYDWRRGLIAEAEPNAAHKALVQLERVKQHFALVTQNVDGLHDRAGNRTIWKVHGDIWTLRCLRCRRERVDRSVPLNPLPPRCECGGLERPGVVWFGEGLPEEVWRRAEESVRQTQVLLVVGTSALVYPAAGLVDLARSSGAKVVEINVEESAVSRTADYCLLGPAASILPRLLE